MDVHVSALKVMVEVGLVHRFVTIIGHHPPDGRSYASGIVSPVKKPGSPPNGGVVSVGAFDEDIAHHAYRADRFVVRTDADDQLRTAGRNGDGPVHHDGLAVADRHVERLCI